MAIKISNSTIIDDSRVIVNASKAGIGTTNPSNTLTVIGDSNVSGVSTANYFDGFFPAGDKVFDTNTTINNNKVNVALESDIIVGSGKTLTVSTGSTIILNPFDFETSSVDELLVNKTLRVGFTSSFDVVTSGIASVGITTTSLIGFGTVVPPNIAAGLLVKEIPGVIAAGTTVVSFVSAGSSTGVSTITISPASLNTGIQSSITFKFGNFGEERSSIILDGETGLIKSSSNTILIDGEENKITINDMVLDASEDGTLAVSYNNNERFRAGNDGYFRLGTSLSGGIQFNGDTAAANALDDYEEGTWTPVLNNGASASTATLTQQNTPTYVKIGRFVYLSAYFTVNTIGNADGFTVGGLPFTCYLGATAGYSWLSNSANGVIGVRAEALYGNHVTFRGQTSGTNWDGYSGVAIFKDTTAFAFSLGYYT